MKKDQCEPWNIPFYGWPMVNGMLQGICAAVLIGTLASIAIWAR